MKKVIAFTALCLAAVLLFCSCGKDMGRQNYNYKMSKYVELDSISVEVDSASDDYKTFFTEKVSSLLVAKIESGKVQKGDSANIDYVGKKDGVAFDGGTAKGYDLVIGSNSFIAGFEDGLIGAEIGSTVDLNLTFPSDYGNTELAGKPVVFTVTVNYVERSFSELTEENVKLCGYKSMTEIEKQARQYAVESVAWNTLYKKAKLQSHPEKETEMLVDFIVYSLEMQITQGYGMTLEQYLTYSNKTLEEFKESIRTGTDVESMSKNYALAYYVIDEAGEKITPDLVDSTIKEMEAQSIVEAVGKGYVEAVAALEKAIVIAGEKATVK